MLQQSNLRVVVLNGSTTIKEIELLSGVKLKRKKMKKWALPRKKKPVDGWAYAGTVEEVGKTKLGREIRLLGFNHNIQSSYGVSGTVKDAIGQWLTKQIEEALR